MVTTGITYLATKILPVVVLESVFPLRHVSWCFLATFLPDPLPFIFPISWPLQGCNVSLTNHSPLTRFTQSSVFVHFLDMIILCALQCILLGTQLKSSGEQLKKICNLFLDADKLQLHLAVSG